MPSINYLSCKLYNHSNFRLPNKIRKFYKEKRIKMLVLLPLEDQELIMLPVSEWERNKRSYKERMILSIPVRPQSLDLHFLHLYGELSNHLGKTDRLFFDNNIDKEEIFHVFGNKALQKKERELEEFRRMYQSPRKRTSSNR